MKWAKADTVRYFTPFGVPTVLVASDARLLDTASEAFAHWRAVAPFDDAVIEVRLDLGDDTDSGGAAEIRVDGMRLTLDGAGISGRADAIARRASCLVPRRLAGDPKALADEALDTLLMFLLARTGRAPVHAAGVVAGDRALALAGPSGSGKSTLALAAMAQGLRILSDDTLYIQLRPAFRVWGVPRPMHLFPEDAPRFTAATRLRGGKLKAVVPLAPGAADAPYAEKASLFVLERGERLDLQPLSPADALARLGRLEPGFDLLPQQSAEALGALAGRQAWRLTLSNDPGAAIDLLAERCAAGAFEA
jgi:hypothetical protein